MHRNFHGVRMLECDRSSRSQLDATQEKSQVKAGGINFRYFVGKDSKTSTSLQFSAARDLSFFPLA